MSFFMITSRATLSELACFVRHLECVELRLRWRAQGPGGLRGQEGLGAEGVEGPRGLRGLRLLSFILTCPQVWSCKISKKEKFRHNLAETSLIKPMTSLSERT